MAALIAVTLPAWADEEEARGPRLMEASLVRSALADNAGIKAARAKWLAMRERSPQARAWEDPMTGVTLERQGATQFQNVTDAAWMMSQTIPWSGKNLSAARAAAADARAAYEEYRRTGADVISRVRTGYRRLANIASQLEITDENETLLRQITDVSRAKFEAGLQSQSDVLLAQIDLTKLGETRAVLRRDQADEQARLNALLNRPAPEPLGAAAPLRFHPLQSTFAQLAARASAGRPEILRAQAQIQAARFRTELAHRQWIPDPQFRIEAREFKGHPGIQEYDTGIAFSIPWVNHAKYSAGIAEAQAGEEAARREAESARLDALALIQSQLAKIHAFAANYQLYRDKIIPLAQQAVEATRAGYETNKTGIVDLLNARRALQDAQSAALNHLADHQAALAELDAIVGANLDASEAGSPAHPTVHARSR